MSSTRATSEWRDCDEHGHGYDNQCLLCKIDALEDVLARIYTWCEAYPVAVFPEPPWNHVHHALQDKGLSLDAVSASNMRHVCQGVQAIIDAAKLQN